MQALEGPHAEIHQLIRQVIELREAGRQEEAEAAYARVDVLSGEIVDLLDRVQQQV